MVLELNNKGDGDSKLPYHSRTDLPIFFQFRFFSQINHTAVPQRYLRCKVASPAAKQLFNPSSAVTSDVLVFLGCLLPLLLRTESDAFIYFRKIYS